MDGSDACAKFLSRRYPNSVPLSKIKLPDSAADLILEYSEANEQLEMLTKKKQRAANTLKQMLGKHEMGFVGDNFIKWLTVTQPRFNAKMLEVEEPDIYERYTVKSSHRRFTIKAADNPN